MHRSSLRQLRTPLVLLGLATGSLLLVACSGDDDQKAPAEDDPKNGLGGAPSMTPSDPPEVRGQCAFGDDPTKCDGAADQICAPNLVETETECNRDADCEDGALCFETSSPTMSEGLCMEVRPVCLNRCGGDFDCGADEMCDRETGRCVAPFELGKRFGESCIPGGDECAGNCVEISETESECEELCRVGATSGCDEEVLEGSDAACAYFAFDLSDLGVDQGAGDAGICAKLCDCNADCPGNQLCLDDPTGEYAGVCTGGIAEEDSVAECPERGVGGAGGMDGG